MGLGFESQADHDDLYIRHNVRFYARYVFVSCVFLASSEIRVINSSDNIFPSKSNSMISQIKRCRAYRKKISSRHRQKLRFETPKAEFFKRIAQFCTCRLTLRIGNDVGLPLFLSIVLVRVLQKKAVSLPLSICVCSCLLIKEVGYFLLCLTSE